MAYPYSQQDPYNDFKGSSIHGLANSSYQPKVDTTEQLTDVAVLEPQSDKSWGISQENPSQGCWSKLEQWHKILIIGLPLLLVLGLGIGVGSQFNFQYLSTICISDDDTSCSRTYLFKAMWL